MITRMKLIGGTTVLFSALGAAALTNQAAAPRTPQTQAVVENLRRIADAGQFVYSWTHPWQETDPAFRAADGTDGERRSQANSRSRRVSTT